MKRFLSIMSIILVITACGNNINQYGNNDTAQNNANNNEDLIRVRDSNIEQVNREEGQEISEHLADLASKVPNVKDATAVVLGNFAFVGIDVEENVERSQVGTIKYTVAETLKEDPYGAEAIVVADPDFYARLQEIGDDIENGQPIQGIMNELSDIAGRLIPEIPKTLQNTNPEEVPEQQKQQLNKGQSQQLDQQQQDQSQNHMD